MTTDEALEILRENGLATVAGEAIQDVTKLEPVEVDGLSIGKPSAILTDTGFGDSGETSTVLGLPGSEQCFVVWAAGAWHIHWKVGNFKIDLANRQFKSPEAALDEFKLVRKAAASIPRWT